MAILAVLFPRYPVLATTCPTSGLNVTIASNCIFDAGTYTFTGTLTINGGVTVTAASNVGSAQVVIVSDSITVNGTISADGTGLSSGGGTGTSTGTAGGGAHGGDGGDGSTDTNSGGNANDSVTAPTGLGGAGGDDPNNGPNATAPGGGSIKLSAPSGTITIAGTVTAGGTAGDNSDDGGGAGGSIWIDAGTLAGAGAVRALGGANFGNGGGGGGGRIAITYTSGSPSSYTLQVHSQGTRPGGAGTIYTKAAAATNGDLIVDNNNAAANSTSTTTQVTTASQTYDNVTIRNAAKYSIPNTFTLSVASAGTLTGGGSTRPEIIVNSGGTFNPPTATFAFTGVDVTNNGTVGVVTDLTVGPSSTFTHNVAASFSATLSTLTIGSGGSGTFTQSGTGAISIPTVTIASGGILNHVANAASKANEANLSATTVTVQSGGQINLDGLGYTSTVGTGTSTGTAGGGAHGGDGGDGSTDTNSGANAYDTVTAPTDLGGAGGDDPYNGAKPTAQGAGALKLVVSGTFTNNGTVSADGVAGDNSDDGGGAGGAVWIDAGTLAGTGTIRARGGSNSGSGGGGGGGRIAITYVSGTPTSYTLQAHSQGTRPGGAGTIFTKASAATNGDLVVDNNNNASVNSSSTTTQVVTASQTFDNVTVRNAAKYVIANTFTLSVASAGAFTGGGTTRPEIIVNSGGTFNPPTATFAFTGVDVTNNGTVGVVTSATVGPSATFVQNSSASFSAGLSSLTVGSGGSGTFTESGTGVLTIPTLTVASGGVMKHLTNSSTKANVLNVSATTVDIQSGGQVNIDSLGYTSTVGTGTSTGTAGGGAHGGDGGDGASDANSGANAYDSLTNPSDLGGAGGDDPNNGADPTQQGAGAAKFVVSGTFTNNGTITSDGAAGDNNDDGGGAGGAIWIDAGTLAGTGTIRARGGANAGSGGGGGGGRIAIFYASGTPTAYTVQASSAGTRPGGAGTIYFKSSSQTNGDLILDNNDVASNASSTTPQVGTLSQTFDNITVRKGAKYFVPSTFSFILASGGVLTGGGTTRASIATLAGGIFKPNLTTLALNNLDLDNAGTLQDVTTVTLTNANMGNSGTFAAGCDSLTVGTGSTFTISGTATFTCTTITVQSGGTLTHASNTTARANIADISATTFDLQTGGTISLLGKGFQQGSGPGAGATILSAASGGGYGGKGGDETFSSGALGGSTYGSVTNPTDLGSGGGNGGTSGNGGGDLKLVVSGTLTVNGTINVNGNPSSSGNGAGGSGGSAWIDAGTLAGSGTITSNGGNGTSAGAGGSAGGGGRIAVFYVTDTSTIVSTAGKLQAYGGTPGSGGSAWSGGAGSIYVKSSAATNGNLLIDNNNNASTGVFGQTVQVTTLSQTYDNVTVRNGAKYTIPSTFTLSIPSAGTLTGGGTLRPSLTVNSGGILNPPTTGTYTFTGIDINNSGTVNLVTNMTLLSSTFTESGSFGSTLTDYTAGSGGNLIVQSLTGLTLNTALIQNGGTLTSGFLSQIPITTLTVQSGGTVTHSTNTTSKIYQLDLASTTIDVQSGGTISVLGKGFQQGSGPGAGATIASAASGGGYGGNGGNETFSSGAVGGVTYGSVTNPTDLGSGGGNGGTSGNGGGALKLTVSGTLTVNGTINVNGNPSSSGNGAGGAGGSAWITTDTLAGSGTVTSNGGNGTSSGAGGSGAGGGRVALFYTTDTSTIVSTAGKLQAYGGTPGSGGSAFGGGAGSVYVKSAAATNGDLLIDNNNMSTTNSGAFALTTQVSTTSQTYDNVTIRNASKYVIPNTFTLTVAASGAFTGGGAVRPSLTTNSGGTFNTPSASQTISSIDVTNGGTVGVVTNLTLQNSIFTHNGSLSATVTDLTFGVGASTFIHNGSGFADTDLVIGNAGTFVLQTTSAYSINSADVQNTGTFESRRLSNFAIATVTVRSGGTMTHTANTTSKLYQLDVSSTTFDVQSGGTVSVLGKGFQQGSGTGTGTTIASAASGGGYGGKGGDETFSSGALGGVTYGSVTSPVDLGSGGGNGGTSGNGGGAVKLAVSGTLTINGTINVNGNPSSSGNGAGGSGGSAWLVAGTLAGSGTVSSNGGNGTSSGAGGSAGGGGRIAVYFTTDTSTLVSTAGKLQAYGGSPGSGGSAWAGGAGSVFTKADAAANGDLRIDNNNISSTLTGIFGYTNQVTVSNQTYDNVVIRNAGKYAVPTGMSLAAVNAMTVGGGTQQSRFESQNVNTLTVGGALTVASNGLLTHSANAASKTAALIVSAGSVDLQSGSSVNVAGFGYASGSGSGAGGNVSSLGAGGGGHGGAGGTGTGVGGSGGSSYDSSSDPTDLGSGGGKVTTTLGGAGGGQVTIVATGTLTINGAITATGGTATNTGTGGGAGGTIRLTGFTVAGTAGISADGGAGQGVIGGCGGGGRIAINHTILTFSGTHTVAGACPASGARTGADGTYVTTQDPNPVPTTTSTSPSSATAGDPGFTIDVFGTNFVPSSVVRWQGTDRTTAYVSATHLTASVLTSDLASAGTFSVTVFNPAPGGGTSNAQTFTVNNPGGGGLTTTSISPTFKTAGDAGFTLTVNGTGFVASSVVRWNGSDRTTTFVNSTQVTAAIPGSDIASAGTASVTVFSPTPGGGTSNSQTFTINNPAPTTTNIAPDNATAGGTGFTLTVNGSNFLGTSVVRWNGVDRTTAFVNSSQVTASIPSGDIASAGTATVTVFNPAPGGGTSNGQTFTINNPVPTTTTIDPTTTAPGGTGFTLTVNGTNFLGTSVVRWNGSDRATTFVNASQVTASILSSDITTGGSAAVTVFNPAPGGGTSNAQTFTIASPGGGGGPPADTTPPVITNLDAVNVTAADARIVWDTDEAANSRVNFGLSSSYGSQATETAFVTSHGLNILGLASGTQYHYQACSTDTVGNQACSTDRTFTTLAGPDSSPPVLSNVAASSADGTSANVTWDTDEDASSFVDYGPAAGPPYASSAGSPSPLATGHDVTLTGLAVNTLYHFRARSADAAGNEASSADGTFLTPAGPDVTPPVITETRADEITMSSAAVLWTTDEAADAAVEYGKTLDYGFTATSTDEAVTSHRVALASLETDTVYHARARSKDEAGNEAVSGDIEFRTAKPPAPVITNVASGDLTQTSARVSWTTDVEVPSRIQYGTSADYAWSHQDLVPKTEHALVIGALVPGTIYHFRVRADDAFGQTTFSPDATFTTLPDVTPPGNVSGFTAAADVGEVRLEWTNPADRDLRGILILRKTGSAPASTSDGSRVYNSLGTFHVDGGLEDGTLYFFKAFAYDIAGNFASGATASATTPIPCRDTDGQDHGTRGIVRTAAGAEFVDSCIDEHRVEEHFCKDRNPASEIYDCGIDRVCEAGRCVAAPVPPTAPITCGNGTCDAGESADSCAADCAAPPTAPAPAPEPPPETTIIPADGHLRFYIGAGGPEMSLSYTDELPAVPNMMIRVYVPDDAARKPVQDGYVLFNGKTWPLRETRSYEAIVTAPSAVGIYPMTVVLNYTDGTADAYALTVAVEPSGLVFEKKDGKSVPVQGATVTLFVKEGGSFTPWTGGKGASANPQTTGASGAFSFFAPAGTYKLRAEKAGYLAMDTLPFDENGGFIDHELELIAQPKPLTQALQEAMAQGTVAEKAAAVAGAIAAEAAFEVQATGRAVKEFVDNPIVEEQTEDVAAPTVAAIAAVNVAAGAAMTATAVPYLLYLTSFLAHPTLLIARRRRKKWGLVYNALTKLPLDLAIVRLIDVKTGRIVRSAVTDKDGRYFFIVPAGEYKMLAIKAGYAFPTSYLRGQTQDISLVDLYHGENIRVEKETSITANIPLDPVAAEKTPAKVLLEGLARKLQTALGLATVLAMVVAAIITPTPKVFAILAGNVALFLFFRRLSATKKPKNWGIVYDEATGKPLQNAVARIFDTKYNKLLETQVTDARGRYAFLVGNNVYYVTFEKPGYQKQQKGPVNATQVEKKAALEQGLVAVDVRLPKAEAKAALGGGEKAAGSAPPAAPPSAPPFPPAPPQPQPHPPSVVQGPVVPTPYPGVDTTGPPRAGPPEGTGPPAAEAPGGKPPMQATGGWPPERAGPAPPEGEGTTGTGVVTGEPPKTSSPPSAEATGGKQ